MEQIFRRFLVQKNIKPSLDKISKIFSRILPIYWAFLTYMLLKPGTENKEYWFMFKGIDKLLHLSIFSALGLLFMAKFPKIHFSTFIYIMLIYAFGTEILQDLMKLGRSAEFLDIVCDAMGVVIGYYVFRKFFSR